jgi:hypothetical protein
MLEIMKNYLYIFTTIITLVVFSQCTKESTTNNAAAANGAGGSTARFTIIGNYLYVVDHTSLKSFDITNPASPVYKDKTEIGFNIETIFPFQDKLFIGSSNAMYIYSLTNPAKPVQLSRSEYIIRMSCDPIVARDSVAYATLRGNGPCGGGMSALVVYNIKNPASPALVQQVPLIGPYGLGIKENGLYVCEGANGLKVYNITNAYNPTYVSTISNRTFFDVIPYGNILLAQTNVGFALYDITNPLQPVFQAEVYN